MSDVCAEITERIMSAMSDGKLPPWRQSWANGRAPLSLPVNAKTSKPYQGINITLLWLACQDSPYWATEKVWKELGADIREGETPTEICFQTFLARGEKKVPFTRIYPVYNLSQVYGCDLLRDIPIPNPDYAIADRMVENSGANIVVHPTNACYDMEEDKIYCPRMERFGTLAAYYTTKLHELGHWTGHRTRLNRTFGHDKKSREYAFEEMVAELTSCFLSASLNLPEALEGMPNHASYIASWLSIMKEDNRAVMKAASSAQKAMQYLLRFVEGREECRQAC